MMGSRGYKGGEECDAFSRYARRLMRWRPGALKLVKRGFWKRQRKAAKVEAFRMSGGRWRG